MQKRWSQFVTTSTKLVMGKAIKNSILPDEVIINKIYFIREQKVMLDKDLAEMYGIEVRVLNQSVKRNIDRFPKDFMFILTQKEFQNLKSQFVISSWGGSRKLPTAFTEQGVAMLSGVLNSPVAGQYRCIFRSSGFLPK
jgi:hypothetical protein